MRLILALALGLIATLAADEPAKTWNFEADGVGSTPAGLTVAQGTWEVVEVDGGHALMQQARNDDPVFNVACSLAPTPATWI